MTGQIKLKENQGFLMIQRPFFVPTTVLTEIILNLDPNFRGKETPPANIPQLSQTIQLNHQLDEKARQTFITLNAVHLLGKNPKASLEDVLRALWTEGQETLVSLTNENKPNSFFENNHHGYRLINTVMELMGAQHTPWNGGEIYGSDITIPNSHSLGKTSQPAVSIVLNRNPPKNASTSIVLPAISDAAYAAYENITIQRQ
jgi:hypothetical protein